MRSTMLGAFVQAAYLVSSPAAFGGGFEKLDNKMAALSASAIKMTVDDPVYKSKKTFECIPLAAILASEVREQNAFVAFDAEDGYRSVVSVGAVLRGSGCIAIRDLDAKTGNWVDIPGKDHGPGPFYLVWPAQRFEGEVLPWPYMLSKYSIQTPVEVFGAAHPGAAPRAVMDGFEIFRGYCYGCHSVNLRGGSIGPELNVPRAAYEYLGPRTIRDFALKPQSMRARIKMPNPPDWLDGKQMNLVLKYLEHMTKKKVCKDDVSCTTLLEQEPDKP